MGDVAKIGFGQAMKNQWIVFDKATNKVTRKVESIQDQTRDQLSTIKKNSDTADKAVVEALKKRKLLTPGYVIPTFFSISKIIDL